MANEKILNTRIRLKYDAYSTWYEKNPELLPGEIAIAYLANSNTTTEPDNGTHAVMFKVGPGKFNSLPWASALAADVHGWAKKSEAEFKTYIAEYVKTVDLSNYYTKAETDALLKAITDSITTLAGRVSALEEKYDSTKKISEIIAELEAEIEAVDTGVMGITGKEAISVTGENDAKEVSLVIDPTAGNVTLSQSNTGLKANIDLSNYATKGEIRTDEQIKTVAAAEINRLIGAADDEGGKTIENIGNLVDYVEENAGDIAQLVTDVGTANTNASNAVTTANEAKETAEAADGKADQAITTANEAKEIAETA